jgi:hypothetical protein
MEGKMFSEETKTVLLSRHGAGIVSQYALYAEQELVLRRLDTNKEAEIRVVGQLGADGKLYTYGVAFLNPDIVTCEDISRGGLHFKSRKEYIAEAEIEVAAPYSPGTQSIFVRAQIVHVVEVKQERRFRCGVCYSKS